MRARIVVGLMLVATPVWAQPPLTQQRPSAEETGAVQRQLELQTMEQALEEAVTRGVRFAERQLPSIPGLVFFAGPIQVRGFVLEDYGVFFDVEYPAVRRSMLWSMRRLDQMGSGMAAALNDLRRHVASLPERPRQAGFEQVIAEMEAELQRLVPTPVFLGASRPESTEINDPREAYLAALKGELTNTIVTHGSALGVTGDQWVSIAARDGRGRVDPRLSGPTPVLRLRLRGRYLEALRQGRLSIDEVRERIEIP